MGVNITIIGERIRRGVPLPQYPEDVDVPFPGSHRFNYPQAPLNGAISDSISFKYTVDGTLHIGSDNIGFHLTPENSGLTLADGRVLSSSASPSSVIIYLYNPNSDTGTGAPPESSAESSAGMRNKDELIDHMRKLQQARKDSLIIYSPLKSNEYIVEKAIGGIERGGQVKQ